MVDKEKFTQTEDDVVVITPANSEEVRVKRQPPPDLRDDEQSG